MKITKGKMAQKYMGYLVVLMVVFAILLMNKVQAQTNYSLIDKSILNSAQNIVIEDEEFSKKWKNREDILEFVSLGIKEQKTKSKVFKTEYGFVRSFKVLNTKALTLRLMLNFQNLKVSKGVQYFLLNRKGQRISSVYSEKDIKKDGKFLLPEVKEKSFYVVMIGADSVLLHNNSIDKVYASSAFLTGFGASAVCSENIACSGASILPSVHLKETTMRMIMVLEEGIGFCTGTLMNSTNNIKEPYVLSAYHCQGGFTPIFDQWEFHFDYEALQCESPSTEPLPTVMVGCEAVAKYQGSDFLLLKLSQAIPNDLSVVYAGWNADPNLLPKKGYMIHHPAGDIKKLSWDRNPLRIHSAEIVWDKTYNSPRESHFSSDLDYGIFQPGSSGAAVFNDQGLVVGQLHGGNADTSVCNSARAYYGRLAVSWEGGGADSNSLKKWLDNGNTGKFEISGYQPTTNLVNLSGKITTDNGLGIANVDLVMQNGDIESTYQSNAEGEFSIPKVNRTVNYSIILSKQDEILNGITSADYSRLKKHILGINPISEANEAKAADINGDGNINSADLSQLKKAILGLINKFGTSPSTWRFEPNQIEVKSLVTNKLNINGYKLGDIDGSANTQN